MAMAKLWERSSIAIIALKRGVQLTTSERMAEDIKVNLILLLCYVTNEENLTFSVFTLFISNWLMLFHLISINQLRSSLSSDFY